MTLSVQELAKDDGTDTTTFPQPLAHTLALCACLSANKVDGGCAAGGLYKMRWA